MASEAVRTAGGNGANHSPGGPRTIKGLPRPFARLLESSPNRLNIDRIVEAYKLAARAHSGQKRASGESYLTHTVEVAMMLARMQLDSDSIICGLIHDIVEDTEVSIDDVREHFGDQVATIVSGVTKIGKVRFRSVTEQQTENYRKMLLSMSEDVRVILVKLADRLHNMRTLEHLPERKRRRIALETREIYAPLAHRLGMGAVRWELEDLAFKFLENKEFEALTKKVRQRRKDREREIMALRRPLESALRASGIPATVHGRPKHLWSIQRKMTLRDKPYEEIYDLMAMRVLTDTVEHCYSALGVIHSLWTPIPERFHDYLAMPKSNLYQSLHTTVFGPGGRRYEIQIRTDEMHRTAEHGVAAHWRYKEGDKKGNKEVEKALEWARRAITGWQADAQSPNEFMQYLRMDLFKGEIFVFTPRGEVKMLPEGATPIDFAYSVHTEVGHRCVGATVNGRIAPLSRQLKNGDTVEIRTDARQRPNRDWLAFVKTARARGRIRHWIRKVEFDSAVQLGRDLLDRELKKAHRRLPRDQQLQTTATALGQKSFETLLAALGRGELGPSAVIRHFFPDHDTAESSRIRRSPFERIATRLRVSGKGVRIQGMDNLMVRYSRCCQPVPGDDAIGYVTRGRGVSIHRTDCPNVLALASDSERRIEIEWAAEKGDRYFVRLYMRGTDRRGLLSDVANAITSTGTNIQHASMRSVEGGMQGEFMVEVRDRSHLEKVRRAIGRVGGVLEVERREHFEGDDLGWA